MTKLFDRTVTKVRYPYEIRSGSPLAEALDQARIALDGEVPTVVYVVEGGTVVQGDSTAVFIGEDGTIAMSEIEEAVTDAPVRSARAAARALDLDEDEAEYAHAQYRESEDEDGTEIDEGCGDAEIRYNETGVEAVDEFGEVIAEVGCDLDSAVACGRAVLECLELIEDSYELADELDEGDPDEVYEDTDEIIDEEWDRIDDLRTVLSIIVEDYYDRTLDPILREFERAVNEGDFELAESVVEPLMEVYKRQSQGLRRGRVRALRTGVTKSIRAGKETRSAHRRLLKKRRIKRRLDPGMRAKERRRRRRTAVFSKRIRPLSVSSSKRESVEEGLGRNAPIMVWDKDGNYRITIRTNKRGFALFTTSGTSLGEPDRYLAGFNPSAEWGERVALSKVPAALRKAIKAKQRDILSESAVEEVTRAEHERLVAKAMKSQGTSKRRAIDPKEHPKRKGLEGPFQFKTGRVLYYDPREGKYYDAGSDMYVDPPRESVDEAGGMHARWLNANQAWQTMFGTSPTGIGDGNRSIFNDLAELRAELKAVGLKLGKKVGKTYTIIKESVDEGDGRTFGQLTKGDRFRLPDDPSEAVLEKTGPTTYKVVSAKDASARGLKGMTLKKTQTVLAEDLDEASPEQAAFRALVKKELGDRDLGSMSTEAKKKFFARVKAKWATHDKNTPETDESWCDVELDYLDEVTLDEARVPKIDDPVYTKKEKPRGYNVAVTPLSAHGSDGAKMLRARLPKWSKADHAAAAKSHERKAAQLDKAWSEAANAAAQEAWGRDYRATDYRVSGIASSEFAEPHKQKLRHAAQTATKHRDAANAHSLVSSLRNVGPSESCTTMRVIDSRMEENDDGSTYPVLDLELVTEGVPERHQRKIARDTLKLSKSGALIMGGMDHAKAVAVLRDAGWSPAKIASQLKAAGHGSGDIKKWMKESFDEADLEETVYPFLEEGADVGKLKQVYALAKKAAGLRASGKIPQATALETKVTALVKKCRAAGYGDEAEAVEQGAQQGDSWKEAYDYAMESEEGDEYDPLLEAEDLRKIVTQALAAVKAGKVNPKGGGALTTMLMRASAGKTGKLADSAVALAKAFNKNPARVPSLVVVKAKQALGEALLCGDEDVFEEDEKGGLASEMATYLINRPRADAESIRRHFRLSASAAAKVMAAARKYLKAGDADEHGYDTFIAELAIATLEDTAFESVDLESDVTLDEGGGGLGVYSDYDEAAREARVLHRKLGNRAAVGIEKRKEYGKTVYSVKLVPKDPAKRAGHELRMEIIEGGVDLVEKSKVKAKAKVGSRVSITTKGDPMKTGEGTVEKITGGSVVVRMSAPGGGPPTDSRITVPKSAIIRVYEDDLTADQVVENHQAVKLLMRDVRALVEANDMETADAKVCEAAELGMTERDMHDLLTEGALTKLRDWSRVRYRGVSVAG